MALRNPDLGTLAVSDAQPAGSNPRDGDAFGALQAEIDKLTDINAPQGPDWNRVTELATTVLSTQGKDLSAAIWLTSAWLRRDGTPGLVDGVHVLRGLHDTFWEDMTPPPARLRARRNQLAWLLEDIEKTLADVASQMPLPPEAHEALLADWDALDAQWQARDSDAPSLFKLRRVFGALPQTAPPQAEPEPVAAAATPTTSQPAPPLPRAAPAPAPATVLPPQPVLPAPPASVASTTALEDSVERVLDALQPLLAMGQAQWPTLPWLYTLGRVRAWSTLERVPPTQGDNTFVPPPNAQEREALARVLSAGDAATIVAHAESRVPLHRFWLDLNRASHAALLRLPDGGPAAAVVAAETARLLARLPGLAGLRFSDGQPFADDATRTWLASLDAGSSPAVAARAPRGGSAFDGAVSSPSDALALATAIAAASAQTEAAGALLAGALERLQTTARHIAATVTP